MPEAADVNVDELRRRARRRLIGAIVLALVAATVVPMLLESEPKPLGEEVSVKIPPIDDGRFVNRLTDSSQRDPAKETKDETKAGAAREAAKEVVAAVPAPQPPRKPLAEAEQRVLAPSTKREASGASTAHARGKVDTAVPPKNEGNPASEAGTSETPKEGFAVQLAAFSDDKGANALANKLKRTGYPAYTESLKTSKSTLWRVRVGPYPSRDAAGEARTKLKDDGYNGIVAPAK